jgi:hypothetical protein
MASSNQDEHDVDVSLASKADDALLGGIASIELLLVLDHLFDPPE